ncbi:MAG: flagellar hook-length control protein FliK, partial [Holophaga sp.]|nr:flagellar hook-length control protein FliK [Holophaga sp.]
APATPAAPAAPAPQAPAPAAGTTQNALDQAYPGAKFQVSYDDQGSPTSKAPLTEFVNQIQMDAQPDGSADAQIGNVPAVAQAAQTAAAALPAGALDMAAALQTMQTLQTPLAGTTALLAPATPEAGSVAGVGALSGNMAAAQAMGAGALPGAAGSVRVTAPAASEDTLPAGQESLLSQVEGSIHWLVKNQDQGAEMQLHPESLGRVQIKLKVEGSVVHAKVWASEASTVPILQDHRSMLETSLKAQGLTLGSFDLQHGRRDQQAPLPAPTETSSSSISSPQTSMTGQESPVSAPVAPARTSRIEFVA